MCGLSATCKCEKKTHPLGQPHCTPTHRAPTAEHAGTPQQPLVCVKTIHISVCGEVWAVPVVVWNMVGARACNSPQDALFVS